MRFIIPLESSIDPETGQEYVHNHVIETESDCAKTNKRKLKEYLTAQAVPEQHHKRVLKELGFWGRFGK
jgi:hypothetical protein